jgi:hypothetical protein
MAESPFKQTTLGSNAGSTPTTTLLSEGSSVELRMTQASRIMPLVALPGIFIAPIVVYFMVPAPLNIAIAILVLLLDIAAFGFLWFFMGASFVRADDDGVTISLMGSKRAVLWDDISGFELSDEVRSSHTKYQLKDKNGGMILEFSDFGNKIDGAKMREFITAKITARQ